LPITACKKKLYALNPQNPPPPVPAQRAGKRIRLQPADARSLEREVRQLLADKVSGNLLGLFLLVPEHLRLGTWDLLRTWAGPAAPTVAPRLALHLVHEAALCRSGLRANRSLRHRGLELVSGLPWLPTDGAVHDLLEAHTIEEFFRFDQPLGWRRAGTLNLHIRCGQMTLALLAQAVIHQLRQRLGDPFAQWDALHLAQELFSGLEGDLRVHQDTLLVTYYNAPQADGWKRHFENLPAQLQRENLDPRVPWLYHFKLDFRFK
jgi:hypothetical protein